MRDDERLRKSDCLPQGSVLTMAQQREVQSVLELIERFATNFRGARNCLGQILMEARKETLWKIRCGLFQRNWLKNPPQLVQFANMLGRQGWRIPSRAIVFLDDAALLQTADDVA